MFNDINMVIMILALKCLLHTTGLPEFLPRNAFNFLFNFSSNIFLIAQSRRSGTLPAFDEWYECARLAKAAQHSVHLPLLFSKQRQYAWGVCVSDAQHAVCKLDAQAPLCSTSCLWQKCYRKTPTGATSFWVCSVRCKQVQPAFELLYGYSVGSLCERGRRLWKYARCTILPSVVWACMLSALFLEVMWYLQLETYADTSPSLSCTWFWKQYTASEWKRTKEREPRRAYCDFRKT